MEEKIKGSPKKLKVLGLEPRDADEEEEEDEEMFAEEIDDYTQEHRFTYS